MFDHEDRLSAARAYLIELDRPELSMLLEHATYGLYPTRSFDTYETRTLRFDAPVPLDEALNGLPYSERRLIVEAIKRFDSRAGEIHDHEYQVKKDDESVLPDGAKLLAELFIERNMLLDVASSRIKFKDADPYYKPRNKRLQKQLADRGIEHPFTFPSTRAWYESNRWAQGLPQTRRDSVVEWYAPVLTALCSSKIAPVPPREPTGWERVDRALQKARDQLMQSHHEEDYQGVGLLCRETIISLAQEVFDPSVHESPDGTKPSDTDAKRMFDAFLAKEAAGSSNEELRKHTRASYDLAAALQHRRTAGFQSAALCLEATSSVVNVIAIIAGRRDM